MLVITRIAWPGALNNDGTHISMNGKGRYIGNVFIARLWRIVKYEETYLHANRMDAKPSTSAKGKPEEIPTAT